MMKITAPHTALRNRHAKNVDFSTAIAVLFSAGLFVICAPNGSASSRTLSPAHKYRVALLDMFYPGDHAFVSTQERRAHMITSGAVDIDGDGRYDPYYHGDLLSLFMQHPAIEIVPYPVHSLLDSKTEILAHLVQVRRVVLAGGRIDAVLLPWESSTLISVLSERLRRDRADVYQDRLRRLSIRQPEWRQTFEIVRALEDVVDLGVNVFTIAGNGGPGMVNLYSLANGVITVGASEHDAGGSWMSHNAFVDVVAPSAYRVRLVRDAGGRPVGYDINENGSVEIPLEHVSGWTLSQNRVVREPWLVLKGSSFAAPTELRRWFHVRTTRAQQQRAGGSVPD